jgi:capsular polysaccharide transport system permease protein
MVAEQHNIAPLRQVRPNRLVRLPRAAAAAAGSAPAPAPRPPATQEPDEEKQRVLALVQRLQSTLGRNAGKKRNWGVISAGVCILAPTLLAALFYLVFASELFVSEARFAIRTNETQSEDVLGKLAGIPSISVISDSYIVSDYILSRDMVTELERRIPLRQMFAHPDADFVKRLDPAVTLEQLVEYWSHRVDVYYDYTKSTIAVRVQAFSAADAETITKQVVEVVRGMINNLSAQARRDAVGFASGELARAELRVRNARQDLISFRAKNNNFDPSQTATAAIGIVGKLESERSQLNSQLAAVSGLPGRERPLGADAEVAHQRVGGRDRAHPGRNLRRQPAAIGRHEERCGHAVLRHACHGSRGL